MTMHCDVFVVGGGPAGLASAIALRLQGYDVIVADALAPPIDKSCGEGLLPATLAGLRSLGVTLRPIDGWPFTGIRFADSINSVEAGFPAGPALGLRRTILNQRMLERADACGVRFLWNAPVTSLSEQSAVAGGHQVQARWFVGADGASSRVRRWGGLQFGRPRQRFGFRTHYRVSPWSDKVEVHWSDRAQIYVTPIGRDEICVVSVSRDSHHHLEHALVEAPELSRRLRNAQVLSSVRGAMTCSRRLPRVYRGHVVLVGDASGSVDAVTGDGIGLAVSHALALAEALPRNDLAGYQAAHRRVAWRPLWMGRLLLLMDGRPSLRHHVFRGMAANPDLFRRMLSLHVGSASFFDTLSTLATLGRELLISPS